MSPKCQLRERRCKEKPLEVDACAAALEVEVVPEFPAALDEPGPAPAALTVLLASLVVCVEAREVSGAALIELVFPLVICAGEDAAFMVLVTVTVRVCTPKVDVTIPAAILVVVLVSVDIMVLIDVKAPKYVVGCRVDVDVACTVDRTV